MRQRLLRSLLLVVLVLPGVAAHVEDGGAGGDPAQGGGGGLGSGQPQDPETSPPTEGYTGPGREPYVSFFQGAWLYGTAAATPLGGQQPRHLRGSGDWLVWEDAARGDVYAYNVPAGRGMYLTSDAHLQRSPDVSGNVVVWEDYRHGTSSVYAYLLDTAETRRVSTGPGNHRSPSVHGNLVAWEDDRNGSRDVWAARLDGSPEFPVHDGPDRESDPLVRGDVVYFRTYRFNVWDVMARDVSRNETFEITSDVRINGAPFTDGRDVLFLTQQEGGWELQRYDARRDRVTDTGTRMGDSARRSVEGDRLVVVARDVGDVFQLVARNLTSKTNTHVSGNLHLASEPLLLGGVVYAPVRTTDGTSLLALKVSEFAWGRQAQLTITAPGGSVAPWVRPINIQGILTTGPGWTDPATFTVTVDGGTPQVVVPGSDWRVTLDPKGYDAGAHRVVFRATFREGPPATAVLSLVVPQPYETVDVQEVGPAFHAGRVMYTFNQYVGSNPAAYFLIPLLLILLVLVAIRLWIVFRARRERIVMEYVPQE